MKTFSTLLLLLGLAISPLMAQRSSLGDVVVGVDKNTVSVSISGSPEQAALARQAFGAHGRYRIVASGAAYDLAFTSVGATQVRVDISKGRSYTVDAEYTKKGGKAAPQASAVPASVIYSETVTGTSPRNALLKAADVAVVKTNGLGLKGFFASKLTFISDGGRSKEVCVSDLFFGEAKQLTHHNALALMPRWSPDGSKIIYTSFFKSGFPDIYLLDVASGTPSVFARFQGTNQGARFSPNGQQVAMVLSGTGTPEIYVTNASGTQRPSKRTSSEGVVKSSPCWSPDGSRLVFSMEPGPQLYVMSAAGGSPQRLSSGYRFTAEPDWSRSNPQKIACTVRTESGQYQIAVYDLSTGKAEVVSRAAFDGVEASWLPDGRHLVYTARDRSSSVLSILDTETGQSKRISATNLGPVSQANVLAR